MKLVNHRSSFIDYRSRRHFGLRVWRDRCQIIASVGSEWTGVGPQLELPLEVPSSVEDLPAWNGEKSALRVVAFRYELVEPGSDLLEVLKKDKPFEEALLVA
jgi:hypothetical protein